MRFHTFLVLFVSLLGMIRWHNYEPDDTDTKRTRNTFAIFCLGLAVMFYLQVLKGMPHSPSDLIGCSMGVLSTYIFGGAAIWCKDPLERRIAGVLGLVVISVTSLGLAYRTVKGLA